MKNNMVKYVLENRTLLIYVVAIIMIIFSGYKQLILLTAGMEFFTLPVSWYVTGINLILIITGIGIIRLKKYGWFGGTSLFAILFFLNLLVVLSYLMYSVFNKSIAQLFPDLKSFIPTKLVFNSKVLLSLIKIIVYGFFLKLFFETDVIEGYGLDRFNKAALIGMVSVIAVIAFFIYVGAYWFVI